MGSYNDFITTHNVIGIAETFLSLRLDAFELNQQSLAYDLHRQLSHTLQRYNETLHNQPASVVTLLTPKQLLHQEVQLLIQYAKILWLLLESSIKDRLWSDWVKLGLIKPSKCKIASASVSHSPRLAQAVNS